MRRGKLHVGSQRPKQLSQKLKESSNYYLSPFSAFFMDYLLWEPFTVKCLALGCLLLAVHL